MTVLAERGNTLSARTVCGYLKKRFMMPSVEVAALRHMMLDCATENDLAMDMIFEDELDMATNQLAECLFALLDADEAVMIVPDLSHFAGNGNPFEVRRDFEREGIRILVACRRSHVSPTHQFGEVQI